VLESMKRAGMTIDLENYIWKASGADPPEWAPELEACRRSCKTGPSLNRRSSDAARRGQRVKI
jgi:hypothetical protein